MTSSAIDLVILDMKAFAPEQHERVTGIMTTGKVGLVSLLAERAGSA